MTTMMIDKRRMAPHRWMVALTVMFLAGLAVAGSAQAQDRPADAAPGSDADIAADTADRDTVSVGGGFAYLPSYDGSNDYVVVPIAAVRGRVSGYDFSTRGTQASVDVWRNATGPGYNFQVGPVVSIDLNRTGRIVDPQVRALGKRRLAVDIGGYVGLSKTGVVTSRYDTLGARISVAQDVTGVHGSYIIIPSIDYGTPLSRRSYAGLSLSATIVGDGYARTYFAVDAPGSLASGLPVFANPKGGLKNLTATALFTRSLTGDLRHGLGIYIGGSYSRLQGDFARSPIVSVAGSANQWLGAIGLGYTF